jgi:CDP-glycerol glycerophosphotransferase (TagB/SpsB family)
MIHHGISIKNYFLWFIEKYVRRYDSLFLYGDYMRHRLIEKGVPADDEARFPMVGYPKLDCLVDGSLDADRIRDSIGLDASRPTVLYAPTHSRDTCSLDTAGDEILDTLTGMDVNVVVKLHAWSTGAAALQARSVHLATGHDSSPYLFVADVLVTDVSSIGWEFALLDRPTIYWDVPTLLERLAQYPIDTETWGRKAGTIVRSGAELRRAVERALADPKEKSDLRQAMVRDLYHEPGTATDRAVARLYEYLKLEERCAV